MPLIGTLQQIGPTWAITPSADGLTVLVGGTPSQFETGGVALDFVPDANWQGSITVQGFGATRGESNADVAPVNYPFRAFYLNGAGSDLSIQAAGVVITDRSSILVPSSGQQIALLVACAAGSCMVYTQAVVGSTAP